VDVANTFTQAINSRALSIYQLQANQNLQVSQRVDDINEKAEQVARLNGEIMRVISVGEQPNDLMDKRDTILDELAKLTGAVSAIQPAGDVIVSINGHVLVQGVKSFRLVASPDPTNQNFTRISWEDGQGLIPRSGELAGLFDARDGVLNDQMDALNDLSATVIARINQLHQSGYAPGKTTTLSTITNTLTGFGAGALDTGQIELAGGNYYVESRLSGTDWQFRVVDATGTPVNVRLSDGSGYSNTWQNVPTGSGPSVNYDTGRGLVFTFAGDTTQYTAASFGAGAAGVAFTQQQDFFTGTDALSIAVNPLILSNSNLVATAVTPNAPGDGELARLIANVRAETLMNGGVSTINQFYTSQTARFGLEVSRAASNAKDRSLVAGAIDDQRMSIAGVNLNEEAANLIKAQKAFEASARLMTVIDQMLDTIINGMGLVGR
jgi:flagellar hook-associated protein 1 FlgK